MHYLIKSFGLLLSITFYSGVFVYGQDSLSLSKAILLIKLDTNQFYSDVMPASELADYYQVKEYELGKLMSLYLSSELTNFNDKGYSFIRVAQGAYDSIRMESDYKTFTVGDSTQYLGTIPLAPDPVVLRKSLLKDNAGFFLTINLYEILRSEGYRGWGDPVYHIIHYELFTKDFQLVTSGRYQAESNSIYPLDLSWFYKDFAQDIVLWAMAANRKGDVSDNYLRFSQALMENRFGLKGKTGLGLLTGFDMPYGGLGIEVIKNVEDIMDVNAGFGFDFSGFKLGAGMRYYVMGMKNKLMPFVGLNYFLTFGRKMSFGKKYDEYGLLLNPDEVSIYSFYWDHALQASSGFTWVFQDTNAIIPTIGYSFAFRNISPELVSGPEIDLREKLVSNMAVGGLSIGLRWVYFF